MSRIVENAVRPEVHGLGANLLFDEHELAPYWGLVSVFEPEISDNLEPIDALGETFELETSRFWKGKIQNPQSEEGGLYEYKLALWSADDPGAKGADFTFRPGYPNAVHSETGETIGGLPDDCPESIRVQIEASNLDPDEVIELLQALADAIDLNPQYFETPADWSSIYKLETYLRVERAVATDSLTGAGALLEQLAAFGNGDGKGVHKWDHQDITGYYEHVALDPGTWSDMIPEQRLAKYLKCYQPEHVRDDQDSDDPLVHHKLESRYWSDYGQESLSWSDVDDHVSELRQTVLSALDWVGVSLDPDAPHFVADEYFDGAALQNEIEIVPNPLEELREQTVGDARDQLVDPGATESQFRVLDAVADGGSEIDYQSVADEAGVSESTVYRAAEQFDDILKLSNGSIEWVDDHVRDVVGSVLDRFEATKQNVERAIERVAEQCNPLSPRSDGEPSALERWINRHGIRVENYYRELRLELDEPVSRRELEEILRAGLEAAEASPTLTKYFENGYIDWVDRNGETHNNWKIINMETFGKPHITGPHIGSAPL